MTYPTGRVANIGLLVLLTVACGSAATITVNENGMGNINGAALSFTIGQDTGPGGASNALIYTIPFTGTAGDVDIFEPETGVPGDVIRFNGNGTLIFYSSLPANPVTLADQPFPPFPVANTAFITESASGSATYTPTAGQPGFDASAPSYVFISDAAVAAVPEPGSAWLVAFGALAFGCLRGLRRLRAV
jgi:hypothetical protein